MGIDDDRAETCVMTSSESSVLSVAEIDFCEFLLCPEICAGEQDVNR